MLGYLSYVIDDVTKRRKGFISHRWTVEVGPRVGSSVYPITVAILVFGNVISGSHGFSTSERLRLGTCRFSDPIEHCGNHALTRSVFAVSPMSPYVLFAAEVPPKVEVPPGAVLERDGAVPPEPALSRNSDSPSSPSPQAIGSRPRVNSERTRVSASKVVFIGDAI